MRQSSSLVEGSLRGNSGIAPNNTRSLPLQHLLPHLTREGHKSQATSGEEKQMFSTILRFSTVFYIPHGYSVAPKYEFVLKSKGMIKRVADIFRGCCPQTFGSPRQFPHTSAAKIRIKKGGTEPEALSISLLVRADIAAPSPEH